MSVLELLNIGAAFIERCVCAYRHRLNSMFHVVFGNMFGVFYIDGVHYTFLLGHELHHRSIQSLD